MANPSAKSDAPVLKCLGGRPVPPEIAADLDLVRRLPVLARQQLYHVLGPCLVEPVPMIEDELDRFCTSHQVAGADLARAIKACRFLLRSAATANLPAAAFLEDLTALCDAGELREALMSGYDQALNVVRREILGAALYDHGKLVERVSWRVDMVALSDLGDRLGLPVIVMTLAYREGDRRDRMTFQVGVERLQELRAMCDRLLPKA